MWAPPGTMAGGVPAVTVWGWQEAQVEASMAPWLGGGKAWQAPQVGPGRWPAFQVGVVAAPPAFRVAPWQ